MSTFIYHTIVHTDLHGVVVNAGNKMFKSDLYEYSNPENGLKYC